jgi:exonuclease III
MLIVSLFFLANLFTKIFCDTECPTIVNPGQDMRINKTTNIRLMQYNVEWLFIDYYAASDCPGSQCTWVNQSEAQKHLTYVSNVVKLLNPDIVNFCEVEGCDELTMLTNSLNNTYMQYLKKGTDTATGQNVGILTRINPLINLYRTEERYTYPIVGSNCGYTGPVGSTGVSKHYITEYKINGLLIAMIGAHLLAIPTDYTRCAEREAQAMVLQKVIMDYYNKNYEIIMIGDFNDYDAEILDSNSHKPTSKVLDILKGNYGDYGGKYQLYSVAASIPQNDRFSDWYDPNGDCISEKNEFSMIDHILVTNKIKEKIVNVFIYQEYPEFCGKYNSDHYPVVIDIDFSL